MRLDNTKMSKRDAGADEHLDPNEKPQHKIIKARENARPPAPRIGGYKHDDYIDWTHLDDDSPGETSSKCVQSISRKRTAVTVSPEAKTRVPKRISPDRVLYETRCRCLWRSRCRPLHQTIVADRYLRYLRQ